jgi:hypothetical protein
MATVASETRSAQDFTHAASTDGARAKMASAGVWLRRTEYSTERFWLPEQRLIVRPEPDPLRPRPRPAQTVATVVSEKPPESVSPKLVSPDLVAERPPDRSLALVARPSVRKRSVRSLPGVSAGSGGESAWRTLRTGLDPSVAERYSIDSASRARSRVVAMFTVLVGLLTSLLTLLLIRSLIR